MRRSWSKIGSWDGIAEVPPQNVRIQPGAGSCPLLARRRARVGLDVEEPALDLDVRAPAPDGVDRVVERVVVQHSAIHEVRVLRRPARKLVDAAELPVEVAERDRRVKVALEVREADGGEGAGEGRRRARREGEAVVVRRRELVAVAGAPEREHVAMPAVGHDLVGERDVAVVAVEVRGRDEQLQVVVVRHERVHALDVRVPVHLLQRLHVPDGLHVALQDRLVAVPAPDRSAIGPRTD